MVFIDLVHNMRIRPVNKNLDLLVRWSFVRGVFVSRDYCTGFCVLTKHFCMFLKQYYRYNSLLCLLTLQTSSKVWLRIQPTWSSVYCLSISLFTSLLRTLKYNFVNYAIEFIGVHQDKMHQVSLANQLITMLIFMGHSYVWASNWFLYCKPQINWEEQLKQFIAWTTARVILVIIIIIIIYRICIALI